LIIHDHIGLAVTRHLLILALAGAPALWAEEKKPAEESTLKAGHSHQGEAFNEGPRQAAVRIAGTGKVSIPIQTGWDQGQEFFNQGVGQLHGFWYYEAERTFREIAAHDSKCAMAYWGMALANWENEKRAKVFIKKAVELKDGASEHNRLFIEAQANYLDGDPKDSKKRKQELINQLENIIQEYPDDIEARAFLCVRLWQFSRGGLPIHSYQSVDAMLQQILAANPMHPAHHFRIHLWDGKKARIALDSAAKLGHTAPGIAHMWHMPGHIYSKLKRWDDSAFAQEASARTDHKYMISRRVLPDQIHNYAHNNEWLARNWMNLGRGHDALEMAKSLIANPRHPKLNTPQRGGRSAKYGRTRIFEALRRFELWEETLRLAGTPFLEPTSKKEEQLKRLRLLGSAHFGKKSVNGVQSIDQEIAGMTDLATKEKEKAENEARKKAAKEKKNEKDTEKAVKEAGKKPGEWVNNLQKARNAMSCFLALLEDNKEEAKAHIGAVQGDNYYLARLHLQLGDHEKALTMSKEAVDSAEKQVLPLLARIEILHALDKKEETIEAFERLKPISAYLDLQAPPVARVFEIARSLDLGDWQAKPVTRDDVGKRPQLDSLGPVAWTPPAGHDFALPNESGDTVAFEDYSGRPLVLIFYLGYGCLHCAEQLDKFAQNASLFEKAGFEVLAISTDSVEDLKKSKEKYAEDGGTFPFPLVSDPSLHVFREWNAYDDFERDPLHGTFIISPGGHVLWQDISADPFMDPEFVVKEGKRMLQLHGTGTSL
jgi:peroxiredoxin